MKCLHCGTPPSRVVRANWRFCDYKCSRAYWISQQQYRKCPQCTGYFQPTYDADGNPQNNHFDNLEVMTQSEHAKIHSVNGRWSSSCR